MLLAAGIVVVALSSGAKKSSSEQSGFSVSESGLQQEDNLNEKENLAAQDTTATDTIAVHVVGCVCAPGIYYLAGDARAMDGVVAAGGFSADAAQQWVNMAQPLFDGAQLRIPSKAELSRTESREQYGVSGAGGGIEGGRSSAEASSDRSGTLIDINTADAKMLETLPGIGPATSEKIIADRTANGPYKSLMDLARVSGIGQKKIESLKGLAQAR